MGEEGDYGLPQSQKMSDVMSWEVYRAAFEPDGMLGDIYVRDTDEQEWQEVLS